jgi:hypothetical protein
VLVEAAPSLRRSSWRSDYCGGIHFRLEYRIAGILGLNAGLSEEVSHVDTRQLTGLSLGLGGTLPLPKVKPWVRAGVLHQHEQGWVSLARSPLTSVLGIGDGIRHRVGLFFAGGAEWPLSSLGRGELFFAPGLNGAVFPDTELGPGLYLGVTLGLGWKLSVEGLP